MTAHPHRQTTRFLATIHTPGCRPVDDDPPVFDTPQQAWAWLAEQRQQAEDDAVVLLDDEGDTCYSTTLQELAGLAAISAPDAAWDGTGSVRGDTPGDGGSHDLGLVYEVTALDDPAVCANPGHDHTAHDTTGTAIDGPHRCGHCGRPAHWDEQVDDYQHDDPTAPDCFLIRRLPGATPCHPERTTH
ncbi:hypothetical protein [Actinocatenispora rupis]|uniref:Uncharacterized protein n=1 Tax=Actinocatenispora rupis TaxID=519421 RepID=A0A8J3J277_9ACTN|nr:hypothetical protein [Actinocatenispora rupis]GID10201.1 hypothetical protein Aru02nite_10900 [Actinocatenispora rupis]